MLFPSQITFTLSRREGSRKKHSQKRNGIHPVAWVRERRGVLCTVNIVYKTECCIRPQTQIEKFLHKLSCGDEWMNYIHCHWHTQKKRFLIFVAWRQVLRLSQQLTWAVISSTLACKVNEKHLIICISQSLRWVHLSFNEVKSLIFQTSCKKTS